MQRFTISGWFGVGLTFVVASCDNKSGAEGASTSKVPSPNTTTISETTAIVNFRQEVESTGKWIDEKQKSGMSNPKRRVAVMEEIVNRLDSVKTDGIPADLNVAWVDLRKALGEMRDAFKAAPGVDPTKREDINNAMRTFLPKMAAVQSKVRVAGKTLQQIGDKYGLDMSKIIPGSRQVTPQPLSK